MKSQTKEELTNLLDQKTPKPNASQHIAKSSYHTIFNGRFTQEDIARTYEKVNQMLAQVPINDEQATTLKLLKGANPGETQIIKVDKKPPIKVQNGRKFPFTRYHTFKRMPQYSLNAPCISIASPYEGSPEQVMRRTEVLNKSKWISTKAFVTTGFKATLSTQERNYIKNYVVRTPS
jgi:hypothetical protein